MFFICFLKIDISQDSEIILLKSELENKYYQLYLEDLLLFLWEGGQAKSLS